MKNYIVEEQTIKDEYAQLAYDVKFLKWLESIIRSKGFKGMIGTKSNPDIKIIRNFKLNQRIASEFFNVKKPQNMDCHVISAETKKDILIINFVHAKKPEPIAVDIKEPWKEIKRIFKMVIDGVRVRDYEVL